MSVVDNRVVKMAFDNADFEKNVGTSLSTIDKLKAALKFDSAIDGLKGISAAAKNVSFDAMENGVYVIQDRFNALDVVASRVLQNITDMAFNTGRQLLSAITIEPLKAGLEEYETQINSVQTILANTSDALKEQGLTSEHDRIEKVNSVLDELNHYADMTIYNFTEMTRNIGTFTAAGVDLDKAATSIQGIANLAAMSGSNSQQASTAMYQLSQAIASGSVKLQDWNSVVNAGMGGKLFQQELIDTAKAMGVVDSQFQQLVDGTMTFRESLSSGWITSDVLTTTLEKFTAGTEGYTHAQIESMQKLWKARGYSETQIRELTGSVHELTEEEEKNLRAKWAEKGFSPEQIDHILEMGSAATDAATKVKTFSQLLETVGEALQSGWTQSWEYIIGDFEQAKMLWTEISDIMNLYIGKSANARNNVLAEWSKAAYSYNEAGELIYAADGKIVEGGKMVAEEMGGRESIIQGLRNTFQGLFEIAVQFGEAWNQGFWGKGTADDISITGEKLINLSRQFQEFTANFKKSLVDENGPTELLKQFRASFDSFAEAMRNGLDGLRGIGSGLSNIFSSFFHSSFFSIDSLNSIIEAVSTLTGMLESFGNAVRKHLGDDGNGRNREELIAFFNGLRDILNSFFWTKLDFINSAFTAFGDIIEHIIGPGKTLSEFLGSIGEKLSIFSQALDNLFEISKVEAMFSSIVKNLKPFIDSIKEILGITSNGGVTGLTAFFNQLVAIMNGKVLNIDLLSMLQKILESILNVIKAIVSVLTPIIHALVNVLGPSLTIVVEFLSEIIDRIHSFTESLVLNKDAMEGVYKLFEGIFTVIKGIATILMDGFIAAWDSLANIFSEILPSSDTLGKNLGTIGEKLKAFGDTLLEIASGETDLPSLGDGIGILGEKIAGFIKAVKDSEFLKDVGTIISEVFTKIKDAVFGSGDQAGILSKIGESIGDFIRNIKEALVGDDGLDIGDIMTNGGILFGLKKLIDFIKDSFGEDNRSFFDVVKENIDNIGNAICDTFEMIQNRLKFDALEKIAKSILMIAAALFVISLIDSDDLVRSLIAIGILMQSMELLMESITKLEGVGAKDIAAVAAAMISLGVALLLVASACKILSTAEPEELARGLLATVALLKSLTMAAKDLSSESGKMLKGASGLIALALAIDLLVIAVKSLGKMDWESLAKGLLGTIALMSYLAIVTNSMSKDFGVKQGAGLLLLAVGIKILASAIEKLGDLSWEQLAKGLLGFAVSLGVVVAALVVLDQFSIGNELIKSAAAILILSVAMIAMSNAITTMGSMNWDELARGLIGFGVAIAGLTAAAIALEHFRAGDSAIALAALSASMILLASALKIIGSMDLMTQIIPGLIGLGGALAIFVVAARLITPEMAAAMLGVAGAIALMGVGMLAFGAGIAALGIAISTSGASLLWFLEQLITFLPKAAEALANALASFVVALARNAGNILDAVKTLLLTVIQAIQEAVPALMELARTILSEFFATIITEAPQFFEMLSVLFNELWTFLSEQVPNFFEFLGTFFTELYTFIQTQAPMLGETFLTILQTLLTVIQTAIPEITGTLIQLLMSLLQQLLSIAPQMFQIGLEIILQFLTAIRDNLPQILEVAFEIALEFMRGITEKLPEIVDQAFKMIIAFINGLGDAIRENHDMLFDAIGNLVMAVLEAIADGIIKIGKAAGEWITGPGGILDSIGGFFQDLFDAGANLVQGFIDGLLSMPGAIWDAACGLAEDAWNAITGTLDEHSPSRLTYGGGKNFTLGFINGISDFSKNAAGASAEMARGALVAFNDTINKDTNSYSPMISPVIDTSRIQNGIRNVNDFMYSIPDTYGITANIDQDNALKRQLIDVMGERNDYSEIMAGMRGLRDEIGQLGAQMSRMQIVMDSGALVGEIAPDIDTAMGQRQILASRGIF